MRVQRRQALQERGRATVELSSKASPLLKQDITTKRLDLLAASPPFILKLEHALVTVAKVDQAGPEPRAHTTRFAVVVVYRFLRHFRQLLITDPGARCRN